MKSLRLPSQAVWPLAASLLLTPSFAFAQGAEGDGADGDAPEAVASGDAVEIAVLLAQTEESFDHAEAFTNAARHAVRDTPGFQLAEGQHALEVIALSLDCKLPPEPLCQAKIGDQIQADRYLWAIVNVEGERTVGTLNYWVRGEGTKSTALSYSSNLTEAADEALRGVARKAVLEVTGGPPKGTIVVMAGSVSGEVFIDGQKVGQLTAGQGKFEVEPGSHRIVVRAPGYEDMLSTVDVESKQSTDVRLKPVAEEKGSGDTLQKTFGFVGLGMGAAFLGVAVYSSIRVNDIRNDEALTLFKEQYPSADDVCAEAESGAEPEQIVQGAATRVEALDQCDTASTFEAMQAVFYPLAGVAGGVGIILLATADWGGDDAIEVGGVKVDLLPSVGPHGGELAVRIPW